MTAAIEAQAAIQANSSAHSQNQAQQRAKSHSRTRSVSDFVPEQLHNTRPRNVTVNLSSGPPHDQHHPMHREQYLAAQRGLINSPIVLPTNHSLHDATKALPSPPPSNKSITGSELDEDERSRPASAHQSQILSPPQEDDSDAEYFLVKDTVNPLKKRKWRALRPLGHGTFSKVLLATSERLPRGTSYDDANLNHKKLVAIKIVEHGPAGGADEERIEVSLKREVDILKSVHHPCIIQLKAMEYTDDRALLVLTYCPGGDLFELASERREVLTKDLVQRIFGEVVSAVRWLHDEGVVHRDLKLESMFCYHFSFALLALVSCLFFCHVLSSSFCIFCALLVFLLSFASIPPVLAFIPLFFTIFQAKTNHIDLYLQQLDNPQANSTSQTFWFIQTPISSPPSARLKPTHMH